MFDPVYSRRQFMDRSLCALAGMGLAPKGEASLGHPATRAQTAPEPPLKLYEGVYQVHSLLGDRNLFQYLFTGDNTILLDTGIARTPQETIFPALGRIGIEPLQITLAVTSHADGDHQGGNDAIKRISQKTALSCGVDDQPMVEDPRALWDLRYNFLKEDFGVGIDPEPSPDAGRPRRMDVCFLGGERLRVRDAWFLEVLHVPGHSRGHLALFDSPHRAAFIGDAVHGRGCPKATGGMALPPTYYYVDVYLSTLDYLESLPIEALYTAHWPVMRGGAIRDFIAESRQTVELFDRVILSSLTQNPSGLTLQDLIDRVGTAFGEWPRDTWIYTMWPIKGHMDRLEERGRVRRIPGVRPVKWRTG